MEEAAALGGFCFPRYERLKKRGDISALFKKGRRVSGEGVRLFFSATELSHNRIAFAFSKQFGCAVQRNRARRLGREAYRHLRNGLKTAFDMVLLVWPAKIDFSARVKQMEMLFCSAGLLKK